MKLRIIFYLLIGFMLSVLCACQRNPDGNIVTNKNDGSFDIKIIQSATENQNKPHDINFDETIYSTDGSIEYTLSIHESFPNNAIPVVEVSPYYLTGEDAQRIAKVLFGEAKIYVSKQRLENVVFSKDEILSKLQRWVSYSNDNAISALYGSSRDETVSIVRKYIYNFSELLETAPVESQDTLCTWDFMKESLYYFPPEEIDEQTIKQDNDAIKAELDIGDIHYAYNVVRRDKEDFKMSRVSAYVYGGISPDNIDERIYTSILCRTDKPTDEQMDRICNKAEQMLIDMQLGEWKIDQCYLQTNWFGDTAEYIIKVTAVPVFEGVSAMRRPQLETLHSNALYASNYYLTDASLEFSADGSLVAFELNSPVQIVDVINSNVATLSLDSLIEKAKQQLSLRDYGEYGLSVKDIQANEEYFGEKMLCKVNVNKVDYGLTRLKVPNTDSSYYYVPGLTLYGSVDYCGKGSGKVYFSSGDLLSARREVPLITLNAIDGSIIEMSNL